MNMVHFLPTTFMAAPNARQERRKPRLAREAIQLPTSAANSKSQSPPFSQPAMNGSTGEGHPSTQPTPKAPVLAGAI